MPKNFAPGSIKSVTPCDKETSHLRLHSYFLRSKHPAALTLVTINPSPNTSSRNGWLQRKTKNHRTLRCIESLLPFAMGRAPPSWLLEKRYGNQRGSPNSVVSSPGRDS